MKIVEALSVLWHSCFSLLHCAEESAQQRFEKARSAADTLAKALEAQGYKVKRVGPKRPISTLSIPTGVQCTSTCTFIPPLCSLHCHLI